MLTNSEHGIMIEPTIMPPTPSLSKFLRVCVCMWHKVCVANAHVANAHVRVHKIELPFHAPGSFFRNG